MFVKYNYNINSFCHIHTINLNIWYIHSPTISKLMKNDLVYSKSQSRIQSNACSTSKKQYNTTYCNYIHIRKHSPRVWAKHSPARK